MNLGEVIFIHSLDLFKQEDIERLGDHLFATAIDESEISITPDSFSYFVRGTLEEQSMLIRIKSAIELARKLESRQLSFNPNLLRMGLGKFDGEDDFERTMGQIAGNLQKILYGGSNVAHVSSSDDFVLYLGTEDEISSYKEV